MKTSMVSWGSGVHSGSRYGVVTSRAARTGPTCQLAYTATARHPALCATRIAGSTSAPIAACSAATAGIGAVLAGIYAQDGPVGLTDACAWAWAAVSRGYRIADASDLHRDTWRRCNDRDVHRAVGVLARFGAVGVDGRQDAMSVSMTELGRGGMRRVLGEPEPAGPVVQPRSASSDDAR
jgi:hypothetical protein